MENDTAIHIKNTHGVERQLAVMLGFVCGIFGPGIIWYVIDGDWRTAASGLIIPVLLGCVWWLTCRFATEDEAILYHDGVELPACKVQPKFQWSDVEKIKWPIGSGKNNSFGVQIFLANKSRAFCPQISLDTVSISMEDRLKLIRYLRLVCTNIPQENWSKFCEWCAVPTVEKCQKREAQETLDGTATEAPKSWEGALLNSFYQIGKRSPFLIGLLTVPALPLVFPLFMSSKVSRKTWWVLAVLLGVSAAIYLPLLLGWNRWVATLLIVIPLVLLVLGCFAAPADKSSKDPAQHVPGGMAWFMAAIFGVPFLLVAGINGWIPPMVAKYAMLGFVYLLTPVLFILLIRRQKRLRNVDKEKRESDAMQRWAAYENTERLSDTLASE